MFGYVKICKRDLSDEDYNDYKKIYCSLCRSLKHNYGILASWTLNYDYAFLALVKLSVNNKEVSFTQDRCPYNPTKKCGKCSDENDETFLFTCSAAILLLYYKLLDNIDDEKLIKRLASRFLKWIFKPKYKKAASLYPPLEKICADMYASQSLAEINKQCLDAAAHPTAQALGLLFSYGEKNKVTADILNRIGYCMGRFVYFADALDDYEKDIKEGHFNPFFVNDNIDSAGAVIAQSAGEALAAYYLLSPCRYGAILENVIAQGLTNSYKEILSRKSNKERQV